MPDYSVRQLATAAYQAGFRGPALIEAVAIALAENPGRQLHATNHNGNGTVDRGPWQINSVHRSGLNPFNLQDNARLAYQVYSTGGGFSAWTTGPKDAAHPSNTAKYKMYLKPAGQGVIASQHSIHSGDTVISLPGDNVQTAVGGGIRTGAGAAITAGKDIISTATAVPTLVGHLLSPSFWKMVGLGILAVFLIIVGLFIVMESNKNVRAATVDGVKAAAV